jgi:hypothetical protein
VSTSTASNPRGTRRGSARRPGLSHRLSDRSPPPAEYRLDRFCATGEHRWPPGCGLTAARAPTTAWAGSAGDRLRPRLDPRLQPTPPSPRSRASSSASRSPSALGCHQHRLPRGHAAAAVLEVDRLRAEEASLPSARRRHERLVVCEVGRVNGLSRCECASEPSPRHSPVRRRKSLSRS